MQTIKLELSVMLCETFAEIFLSVNNFERSVRVPLADVACFEISEPVDFGVIFRGLFRHLEVTSGDGRSADEHFSLWRVVLDRVVSFFPVDQPDFGAAERRAYSPGRDVVRILNVSDVERAPIALEYGT
jgi:hypothetical protein